MEEIQVKKCLSKRGLQKLIEVHFACTDGTRSLASYSNLKKQTKNIWTIASSQPSLFSGLMALTCRQQVLHCNDTLFFRLGSS